MNKKDQRKFKSVKELNEWCADKNLRMECVSEEGANLSIKNKNKLLWKCLECEEYYEYSLHIVLYDKILKNKMECFRCLISNRKKFESIKELNFWVKEKGLRMECVSVRYNGQYENLQWKCLDCEKPFETSFFNMRAKIKRENFKCLNCISCEKKRFKDIDELNLWCRSKGFLMKCVSNSYNTQQDVLDWQCLECGKIYKYTIRLIIYQKIKKNRMKCNECLISKLKKFKSIEDLNCWARNNGVLMECISEKWTNKRDKLDWKCLECNNIYPHKLDAIKNKIKIGNSKCHLCETKKFKNQKELEDWLFKNRKAKLLTQFDNFIKDFNTATKIEIECVWNHKFSIDFNHITNGKFCPECSEHLGEKICRKYFEKLFNCKFPNVRVIKYSEKTMLELDGFSEKVFIKGKKYKVAFEHQGEQHYKPNGFKNFNTNFELRKIYDEFKRKWCAENNVVLIEIPEIFVYLTAKRLPEFVTNEFLKKDILVENLNINEILNDAYLEVPDNIRKYEEFKKELGENGYKLLDKIYANSRTYVKTICPLGHLFETNVNHFRQGVRCYKCYNFYNSLSSKGFHITNGFFYSRIDKRIFNLNFSITFKSALEAFICHKVGTYLVYIKEVVNKKELREKILKVMKHKNMVLKILINYKPTKELMIKLGLI